MTPADLGQVVEGVTEAVAEHVGELSKALEVANKRIADLEERWLASAAVRALPPENAYQISVRHGFSGDEVAWLASLKAQNGRPGQDGKDADPVDVDAVVERVKALVPVPHDGRDGKDAEPVDLDVLALKAAELVPRPTNGEPGRDGTSVTIADIEPLVSEAVTKAVLALPAPKDGRDGKDGADAVGADMVGLERMAVERVDAVLDTWPKPKDGRSVTMEELTPVVQAEVTKAVAALPVPKDPVGLVGALIDRDGSLVVTMSDGSTRSVGAVVGRDGRDGHDVDMATVQRQVSESIAALPIPKDGKDGRDGLGFEDLQAEYDEDGRLFLVFERGGVEPFRVWVPGLVYRGVYLDGVEYRKADAVTRDGSIWIAHEDTKDRPGDGKTAWQLAVKKGTEGKRGLTGEKGDPGTNGKDGIDLNRRGYQ